MAEINFDNLNVLLVDDEPFIQKLIEKVLFDIGVKEVMTASHGGDALEKIRTSRKRFDLVICDLEMPNMNGFQFVEELRKGDDIPAPDVPVVILTGHSNIENLEDALDLGIHGFLAKPVSKQSLEKKMTVALTSPPIDPSILKRGG